MSWTSLDLLDDGFEIFLQTVGVAMFFHMASRNQPRMRYPVYFLRLGMLMLLLSQILLLLTRVASTH